MTCAVGRSGSGSRRLEGMPPQAWFVLDSDAAREIIDHRLTGDIGHRHSAARNLIMTVPFPSIPELLVLHAVRLLGMAEDHEVAVRFDLDPSVASELLLDFEAMGWITHVEFAGTGGWTLTDAGRRENGQRLADELATTDSRPAIEAAYGQFLPHNDRLLRAATDWQLRPSQADPLAVNDHRDQQWDRRVLDELAALGADLRRIDQTLSARLSRFRGYGHRFAAALDRVRRGELSWVNRPKADSCHTVWMQLHEDLLATLGRER
jgi:hypothetical protein